MKTYPVNKQLQNALLHQQLVAAGVNVVTVRATGEGPLIFDSGEVVTDDAANDAVVQGVIAGHNAAKTFQQKLDEVSFPVRLAMAHNEILWARSQSPPVAPPAWAVALINDAHGKISSLNG